MKNLSILIILLMTEKKNTKAGDLVEEGLKEEGLKEEGLKRLKEEGLKEEGLKEDINFSLFILKEYVLLTLEHRDKKGFFSCLDENRYPQKSLELNEIFFFFNQIFPRKRESFLAEIEKIRDISAVESGLISRFFEIFHQDQEYLMEEGTFAYKNPNFSEEKAKTKLESLLNERELWQCLHEKLASKI
ncbi:31274_t:CDS:2 [Gigaspora margarita]|uniref:31274_t:CDS:1 n=1 Tax=Gigaspora margarita TaxID=4874 RepID=A0ABM8W1C5_GIGMA|nr:31274_t:CDS:2 [Gigaspora margarita]